MLLSSVFPGPKDKQSQKTRDVVLTSISGLYNAGDVIKTSYRLQNDIVFLYYLTLLRKIGYADYKFQINTSRPIKYYTSQLLQETYENEVMVKLS